MLLVCCIVESFPFRNALRCRVTAAPLSILQGREGVASALAACKILKEMSRLETETKAACIMKEAKYEQLAVGKSWHFLNSIENLRRSCHWKANK